MTHEMILQTAFSDNEGNDKIKNDSAEGLLTAIANRPETQKWALRSETQKYLKEDIEVVFDFIIKGEYCETKEEMTKELKRSGLEAEKRMIQATDRKLLDVRRQTEIDEEIKKLDIK